MKILCKTQTFSIGQKVNTLGKYINRHIDGAYKIKFSPNMCDVYMLMYFQEPGNPDLQEMHFDINITTYQNKIRVNVTEISPHERTIGHDTFDEESLKDLNKALYKILNKKSAPF